MFHMAFYSAAKTAPHYRRGQSFAAAHDRYVTWIEHLGSDIIGALDRSGFDFPLRLNSHESCRDYRALLALTIC